MAPIQNKNNKKKIENNIDIPITKWITVQDETINTVCPRSGCTIKENTHKTNVAKEIVNPALGLFFWFPEIIQAIKTIKNGFRNSEGWIVTRSKENHLIAPLPKSVP